MKRQIKGKVYDFLRIFFGWVDRWKPWEVGTAVGKNKFCASSDFIYSDSRLMRLLQKHLQETLLSVEWYFGKFFSKQKNLGKSRDNFIKSLYYLLKRTNLSLHLICNNTSGTPRGFKHSWASASRKLTPASAFRHP